MAGERVRERIDEIYRSDSRRVLATLIRLLGDFDRAEEALHDAFAAALEAWTADGVPANPRAWLVSTRRLRPWRTRSKRASGRTLKTKARRSKTIACGSSSRAAIRHSEPTPALRSRFERCAGSKRSRSRTRS